jgi:mannose-6-phosphate isomerase-like protein (cupin superfamily)
MGSRTEPPVSPTLVHPLEGNGRFDIAAIAASLPAAAETLLADHYLTDRPEASARVFRVYRPIPPHYHATCDEFLYAFSGRGTFWLGDEATEAKFAPGQLLFFSRRAEIIRTSGGLSLGRYAAPRPAGCHLRQSGRRHAADFHGAQRREEIGELRNELSAIPRF